MTHSFQHTQTESDRLVETLKTGTPSDYCEVNYVILLVIINSTQTWLQSTWVKYEVYWWYLEKTSDIIRLLTGGIIIIIICKNGVFPNTDECLVRGRGVLSFPTHPAHFCLLVDISFHTVLPCFTASHPSFCASNLSSNPALHPFPTSNLLVSLVKVIVGQRFFSVSNATSYLTCYQKCMVWLFHISCQLIVSCLLPINLRYFALVTKHNTSRLNQHAVSYKHWSWNSFLSEDIRSLWPETVYYIWITTGH